MEAIYFNKKLYHHLKTFLPVFAERVTAAGKVVKKHLPTIPWNSRTLWIVCGEEAVRRYICGELNRLEAIHQGLECEWGRREPGPGHIEPYFITGWNMENEPEVLAPEVKRNRRFVTDNTRPDREAIMALAWNELADAYLRTSAVTIGDNGRTIVAHDADTRLKDFCTLSVETEEQAAFVEAATRVKDLAEALASSFDDLCAATPSLRDLKRLSAGYDPARLPLIPISGGVPIPLCAPNAIARALITFFSLASSVLGSPKFYNRAGYWAYFPADVGTATGGMVTDTSGARSRVPELYGIATGSASGIVPDVYGIARIATVCPALPTED